MGAIENGTLGVGHDGTLSLEGKVDAVALRVGLRQAVLRQVGESPFTCLAGQGA